jgi:hypothetical protein
MAVNWVPDSQSQQLFLGQVHIFLVRVSFRVYELLFLGFKPIILYAPPTPSGKGLSPVSFMRDFLLFMFSF